VEDNKITVLDPAELVQAVAERIQHISTQLPRTGCYEADARDLASTQGRLGGHQDPRPDEQKVAPSHRITGSWRIECSRRDCHRGRLAANGPASCAGPPWRGSRRGSIIARRPYHIGCNLLVMFYRQRF